MKTLVIGGAGFIGSHLCDALLQVGHSVLCVDDFSRGTEKNVQHLVHHSDFQLYETDASDRKQLNHIFQDQTPEYVFHLAANSDIQASAANPDIEYKSTYQTTYEILNCMKNFHVRSLFFASTSAVYGDKRDMLLNEETPNLSPVSYYGAAKLGSEALISAFSHMNHIKSIVFRFPNVIGARLTHGVIYDFINKLMKNPNELQILGNGKQKKPYMHVSDLIDAILLLMGMGTEDVSLYNVGVDTSTAVDKIADIVCEQMELKNVAYSYTGGSRGWRGDVPEFRYSLEKIHKMGWRAKYTSDEAVRKTVKENLSER